jgi:hypothetical protein
MRIIEESLTCLTSELDNCLQTSLAKFQDALSGIDFNLAIADRSNSMRKLIKDFTENIKGFEWIPRTRDGQAPFSIDGKYACNGECNSIHILNVVICLNNREAIGTNFLKLEVAALSEIRRFQETEVLDSNILGVLISLDRDVLTLGKWDPSYADSSEYSGGLRKFYKSLLKSNITNLRIHQS